MNLWVNLCSQSCSMQDNVAYCTKITFNRKQLVSMLRGGINLLLRVTLVSTSNTNAQVSRTMLVQKKCWHIHRFCKIDTSKSKRR